MPVLTTNYTYTDYADMVRRLLAAGKVAGTRDMTLEHAVNLVVLGYGCDRATLVRLCQ